MGSACLYQLAKRGASVLGLEQFDIAHALGSSGGISRQTKVMPYLGGRYEPLIRRANENWQTLEKGAQIRAQEAVTDWSTDENSVAVTTNRGKYRAKHLVLAAGAWNAKLVPQLRGKLHVTRLSLGWFAPETPAAFSVDRFPIWLHGAYYGFPVLPDFPGFKVAKHWRGAPTDPDNVDRTLNAADEQLVRSYVERHLPSTNGSVLAFKVCMYTNGGPWLGPLPGEKRVTFIAACNGGGFKFSSAYGEALADLATEGRTELSVDFMALSAVRK